MVVQPVDGIVVARSLEGISQRRRDPELEQIVSDQLSRVEQESIKSQAAPAPMIAGGQPRGSPPWERSYRAATGTGSTPSMERIFALESRFKKFSIGRECEAVLLGSFR